MDYSWLPRNAGVASIQWRQGWSKLVKRVRSEGVCAKMTRYLGRLGTERLERLRPRCAAASYTQSPAIGSRIPNPNGILPSSPGLRPTALPWGNGRQWPSTPKGFRQSRGEWRSDNPVGVEEIANPVPRVGARRQPRAGGHNPFGIAKSVAVAISKMGVTCMRCPRTLEIFAPDGNRWGRLR